MNKLAIIKKLPGTSKYRLYSRKKDSKGKRKNLGTYDSLKGAKEREKQITFFKLRNQHADDGPQDATDQHLQDLSDLATYLEDAGYVKEADELYADMDCLDAGFDNGFEQSWGPASFNPGEGQRLAFVRALSKRADIIPEPTRKWEILDSEVLGEQPGDMARALSYFSPQDRRMYWMLYSSPKKTRRPDEEVAKELNMAMPEFMGRRVSLRKDVLKRLQTIIDARERHSSDKDLSSSVYKCINHQSAPGYFIVQHGQQSDELPLCLECASKLHMLSLPVDTKLRCSLSGHSGDKASYTLEHGGVFGPIPVPLCRVCASKNLTVTPISSFARDLNPPIVVQLRSIRESYKGELHVRRGPAETAPSQVSAPSSFSYEKDLPLVNIMFSGKACEIKFKDLETTITLPPDIAYSFEKVVRNLDRRGVALFLMERRRDLALHYKLQDALTTIIKDESPDAAFKRHDPVKFVIEKTKKPAEQVAPGKWPGFEVTMGENGLYTAKIGDVKVVLPESETVVFDAALSGDPNPYTVLSALYSSADRVELPPAQVDKIKMQFKSELDAIKLKSRLHVMRADFRKKLRISINLLLKKYAPPDSSSSDTDSDTGEGGPIHEQQKSIQPFAPGQEDYDERAGELESDRLDESDYEPAPQQTRVWRRSGLIPSIVKLANHLDEIGATDEADELDALLAELEGACGDGQFNIDMLASSNGLSETGMTDNQGGGMSQGLSDSYLFRSYVSDEGAYEHRNELETKLSI
jgi:hypothetical protein